MLAFLIFASLWAWFFLQFRPARRAVWARRFGAVEPVVVHVAKDIVATIDMVQAHFQRRRILELEKHDLAMARMFRDRES